jgi:type IV secretory pathway VirB4 component
MENQTDKIIEILTKIMNESENYSMKHIIFDKVNGLEIIIKRRLGGPGVVVEINNY